MAPNGYSSFMPKKVNFCKKAWKPALFSFKFCTLLEMFLLQKNRIWSYLKYSLYKLAFDVGVNFDRISFWKFLRDFKIILLHFTEIPKCNSSEAFCKKFHNRFCSILYQFLYSKYKSSKLDLNWWHFELSIFFWKLITILWHRAA